MADDAGEARIEPFHREEAGEREVLALNRFSNRFDREGWPDDPPYTLRQTRNGLLPHPPHVQERRWIAWTPEGEIAAHGSVTVWNTGENEHCAGVGIRVLPEWRRRGLGSRLLALALDASREWNRRLLFASTLVEVPAGEAFMQRVGAREGLRETLNQLDLEEQDPTALRALIGQWIERAPERAPGFRLGLWVGPYPEESLEEVAAMYDAQNLMPRGDLEMEDEHTTPERIRAWDERMVQRGEERWSLHARDPETGRIAGYTEVFWDPERPELMWQGDTAVFKEYQNRGLGRWLKAEMLRKILEERPQVRRIRTGNASSNAPMLAINHALGFELYRTSIEWQVEVARVEEYLRGRGA